MVKRFLIFIIFFLLFLFVGGASPDAYYSRAERLLSGLNTVALQANALPVVTGALDEARKNPRSNYYQNIIVLADAEKNRSWRAYENSRKQTRVYTAAQLVDQTLAQVSSGQNKYFYDETSGAKYAREDRRQARDNFFADYSIEARGADDYLENILISPDQYLEQIFVLEIPELPDPRRTGFSLPSLNILPLGQQTARAEPQDFQWKIKAEPVYGVRRKVNDNTIEPESNFGVGLKIISPEGVVVKNKNQLGKLTPFIAVVPLPENSAQLVNFKQTQIMNEVDVLNFAEEPAQESPGRPMLVNYVLPKNIQVVEFSVNDALGRPVYVKKESLPDPQNPLPFAWTPEKRSGEYYAELKGYDAQNKIQQTEPKLLRLANAAARKINYIPVPSRQSGDYYSVLDFSASPAMQGLNKIYFWLYGTEDNTGLPVAASLYITFSAFAPENSTVSAPSETEHGRKQRVRVHLLGRNNEPISGARVEFISLRNQRKIIDKFSPVSVLTNVDGEAFADFVSDIPGEAELYALSDQVWVNNKPLIIKVLD